MKGALAIISFILLLIIAGGLYYYSTYLHLQKMKSEITLRWDNVSTELDHKANIVLNISGMINSYLNQMDNSTFDNDTSYLKVKEVVKALRSASGKQKKINISFRLESIVSNMLETIEKYPQIKANDRFVSLISKLEAVDKKIEENVKKYNEAVGILNEYVTRFPVDIIADGLGIKKQPLITVKGGKKIKLPQEK